MSCAPQPSLDASWTALATDVRKAIAKRVDDSATVDDLVQDVFVRVQTRREQLEDDERLAAWVGRVTRNIIADHYRRTRPSRPLPEDVAAEPPEPATSTEPLAQWVARSLTTLDAKYRDVLELTELQGLTQRQAAERLELSLPAVKSRVLRGRAMLLERLQACCAIELDRRGGVVDYEPRGGCC